MVSILAELTFPVLLASAAIAVLAGFVKGVVGFALPMVFISGLSSVMAPELALAGLILPTVVTNLFQAMRQGPVAAWHSVRRFYIFLGVGLTMLMVSASLVATLPAHVLLVMIGIPVTVFAVAQLAGWELRFSAGRAALWEPIAGGMAGFIGGFSGIWGPPTVAYLTALNTEKTEQMRVQGVIYGLGAVGLAFAHLVSGVLNASSVWLSVVLVPPAMLGLWLGGKVQDRIDQRAFKRATLIVLLIGGLNLVRRAVF